MEQATPPLAYPLQFDVDYPDRPLDRLTSAFRIFTAIPIMIVLGAIGGGISVTTGGSTPNVALEAAAFMVTPPFLMILFRQKSPRWWYDFNLELLRFQSRV